MFKKMKGKRWFHAHEIPRVDELNGLQLASFKRRGIAFLLDGIFILLIKSPLYFLLFRFLHPDLHHFEISKAGEHLMSEIDSIAGSILYFGVLLKVMRGQTPGKKLMKIRVLSLTHHELSWWQSIERALGYGASLLEAGTGFLQYYINRNRMCVHDRIAETIVVDQSKQAIRKIESEASAAH